MSTFRYHVAMGQCTDSVKRGVADYRNATNDAERKAAGETLRTVFRGDPLLRQFFLEGHRRELHFVSDAEHPIQIELGAPEIALAAKKVLWPVRLRSYKASIMLVTATSFMALPADRDRLRLGRYGLERLADLEEPTGPFVLVTWENISGGRYRLEFECLWWAFQDPDDPLQLIYELGQALLIGRGYAYLD